MAVSAEDLHRQLVVGGSGLSIVELEVFHALGEQDLMLVKEC